MDINILLNIIDIFGIFGIIDIINDMYIIVMFRYYPNDMDRNIDVLLI